VVKELVVQRRDVQLQCCNATAVTKLEPLRCASRNFHGVMTSLSFSYPSIYYCLSACLHSLTIHDTSLTIIPHSINPSNYSLQYYRYTKESIPNVESYIFKRTDSSPMDMDEVEVANNAGR
jgi:hypothetical protein